MIIIEKVIVGDGGTFCSLCDEFIPENTLALRHKDSTYHLCIKCLTHIAELPIDHKIMT